MDGMDQMVEISLAEEDVNSLDSCWSPAQEHRHELFNLRFSTDQAISDHCAHYGDTDDRKHHHLRGGTCQHGRNGKPGERARNSTPGKRGSENEQCQRHRKTA